MVDTTNKLNDEERQLFRDILKAVQEDQDYETAVKLCKIILEKSSVVSSAISSLLKENTDLVASVYEIYVKSLLHCENYAGALALLSDSADDNIPKKNSSSITPINMDDSRRRTLQAYTIYRTGDYKQAIALTSETEDDNYTMKLIAAQSLFHLGQSEKSHESFLSIANTRIEDDEEKSLLLTNSVAAMIASATPYCHADHPFENAISVIQDIIEKSEDSDLSYDLAYNLATWKLITDYDRSSGKALLHRAVLACKEQNDQESEANQERELAPLLTNMHIFDQIFWNPYALPMDYQSNAALTIPAAVQVVRKVNSVSFGSNLKDATNLLKENPQEKLTPLQQRIWYYNRAIVQLRSGMFSDCKVTCQSLLSALKASATSQKNPKKKKNSAVTTAPVESSSKSSLAVYNKEDLAWWESRVTVLIAYSQRMEYVKSCDEGGTDKIDSSTSLIQAQVSQLKELPQSPIRDHALAYIQLHLYHIEKLNVSMSSKDSTKDALTLLETDLPDTIRRKPAVLATIASYYNSTGQLDKAAALLKSTGDVSILADFAMSQGNHDEAATLYENAAENDIISKANLVKALSFTNPDKALLIWSKVFEKKESYDSESDDGTMGADLESREVPRLKSSMSRNNDMIIDQSSTDQKRKKKSHDAILRRRARKREEHLANLHKRGVYNPDHPTKPDPERWLPKYERSYNRRRRNKGGVHKGAQGGVSDKDAAKLDVVARQQARASGEADAAGRSTAHMAVVGGGMIGRKSKGGKKR